MTNIRVLHNKNKPYFQLNRKSVQRTDLSWGARGLWSYLLSLPDDWDINVKHLITQSAGGRDMVLTLLNELKEGGLCYLFKRRRSGGMWSKSEYIIAESSEILQEELERLNKCLPRTGFPDPVNPVVYIKDNYTNKDIPKGISKDVANAPSLPSFSSDVEKLCKHLIEKIQSHGVKFKDPRENKITWFQWRQEMDKLIRIDHHSPKEIMSLIDFSHDDDFWCQNILSPKKLRKHTDKLLLQIAHKDKKPPKEQREKLNREGAKKIVDILKKNPIPQDILIECCSSCIEIGHRSHPNKVFINYSENGFQDQLENELRRMGLFKYLT